MARFLAQFLAVVTLAVAGPVLAAPVDTGHLMAELVAQTRSVAPGQTVHVALRQKIDKGWHTYWRNPGDSGGATTLGRSVSTAATGTLAAATPPAPDQIRKGA